MSKNIKLLLNLSLILGMSACHLEEERQQKITTYKHLAPHYDKVGLHLSSDTLHLGLNDSTYNKIGSLNVFNDKGTEYLAIYELRSASINIYNLSTQQLVKKFIPAKYLSSKRLYKPSVYCKNFDSIFIRNNKETMYLLDSAGKIISTSTFPETSSLVADFKSHRPLVITDSLIFAGIRPSGLLTTLKQFKQWNVMYGMDFRSNKMTKYYHLPETYQSSLWGFRFLNYSYCHNNRGNFVFSFPADSNLYETNLSDLNVAHYGGSKYQKDVILPVSKRDLDNREGGKQFHLRDAYGAIYYDAFHKRYLRYFRQKISEADYVARIRDIKESIIIFDEYLQIVGESTIPEDVSFSNLFITSDGRIFAQVKRKDEDAIHFIRVDYEEFSNNPMQLSKK